MKLKPMKLPYFPNPFLLQTACTHSSIDHIVGNNYERLECLGDSFLDFIMSYILAKKYNCEKINYTKELLVANKNLSKWCQLYGINKLVNSKTQFDSLSKINADVFESYLGCWSLLLFSDDKNLTFEKVNKFDDFNKNWDILVKWMKQLINDSNKRNNISKFLIKTKKKKIVYPAIIKKQNQTIGESTIKFILILNFYNEKPTFTECDLTRCKDSVYQTSKYKSSFKNKSQLLIHIGEYIRSSENNYDLLKRFLTIENLVVKKVLKLRK